MHGKPKISVIIPTFNRKDKLHQLLESLINQEKPVDFEIIVVVDGSNDGTMEFLKDYCIQYNRIRYIQQSNNGRGVARNKGAEIAQADILAFIDDDCIADKMWLNRITDYFENHSDTDMVHGLVNSTLPEMPPFIHSIRIKNVEKGVFAIKKEIFKKVGGFDPVLSYWAEDLDFFLQARKNNVKIAYEGSVIIHHLPSIRGFKYLKNIITIKGWHLLDYIVKKNPTIWAKNSLKNELFRALLKLTLIIVLLLPPFHLFFRLILIETAFFSIAMFYTLRTIFKIKGSKEDLKIPLIDILLYCLIGWTCSFMNILAFIISRFCKNPYIAQKHGNLDRKPPSS